MMLRPPSIAAVVFCGAMSFPGCKPTDVIEDLGTLGGVRSLGLGINSAGNVTGASYLSSGDPHSAGMHAFRYVDGLGMIDFGALPPGNISEGNGINSGGFICGGSFVEGFVPHAFYGTAIVTLVDIGTLGGEYSYAWDINDHIQITGEAETTEVGQVHAFLWTSEGGMRDLGTLGGTRSVGRSINESGQIAGESRTPNGGTRAFRFTEGVGMVDLGTLGGAKSSGYGINDSGQVVGESDTGFVIEPGPIIFQGLTVFGTHAFLWSEGAAMMDLGHLGGGESCAYAVNNQAVVVGTSELANGTFHAFRWTSAEGMVDLNTLLPSGSGWVLTSAMDVNDKGQITGYGLHDDQERAFRLNPQPGSPD